MLKVVLTLYCLKLRSREYISQFHLLIPLFKVLRISNDEIFAGPRLS